METVGGQRSGETSSIRKVVTASFVGTTVEWYDFFLYGTAAALVFNSLFFPNFSELAGTLAAFGAFAAGFIARPLGGIVFGHYGDKIGRKSMLVMTLLIMGVATFAIGLLPTYETIGVAAPILLVVCRLLQGFAVGGEWGGAVLMAVEHSPANRRGFYGSWPQSGSPAGLVLATAAFGAATLLPEPQFLAWGWRIPFLLSAVLVVVGLVVRLKIMESPAFLRIKESQTQASLPIIEAVKRHPKNILLAMAMCVAPFVTFYLFAVFILTYATTQLGLSQDIALLAVMLAAIIEVVTIPAYAALSDKVGRRLVFIAGTVALLVMAFPLFWIMDTGVAPMFFLGTVLGLALIHPAMYGPLATLFAELFSAQVRYSGASIGYQLGAILGGGFAPLILTSLLAFSGGNSWVISLYIIGAALVTIVGVYLATELFIDEDEGEAVDSQAETAATRG